MNICLNVALKFRFGYFGGWISADGIRVCSIAVDYLFEDISRDITLNVQITRSVPDSNYYPLYCKWGMGREQIWEVCCEDEVFPLFTSASNFLSAHLNTNTVYYITVAQDVEESGEEL